MLLKGVSLVLGTILLLHMGDKVLLFQYLLWDGWVLHNSSVQKGFVGGFARGMVDE